MSLSCLKSNEINVLKSIYLDYNPKVSQNANFPKNTRQKIIHKKRLAALKQVFLSYFIHL